MPAKTETTWECTRCHAVLVFPVTVAGVDLESRRPTGWVHLDLPPGGADLCTGCRNELIRFVGGHSLIPPEGMQMADLSELTCTIGKLLARIGIRDGEVIKAEAVLARWTPRPKPAPEPEPA